jgi:predicted RNA-binding protein
MTDEDFFMLKFEQKAIKETIAKLEVQVRDIFGDLKELSGKVSVSLEVDYINEQLKAINATDLSQQEVIGKLAGAVQSIKEVLSHSSDKALANAAKGLTINVAGGGVSNAVNFNQEVDRANVNSGSGTQTNG